MLHNTTVVGRGTHQVELRRKHVGAGEARHALHGLGAHGGRPLLRGDARLRRLLYWIDQDKKNIS